MSKQYIPVRFEKDVWVVKSEYELVDKDGEELPNQLLCHSVIASSEHLHNVVAMPELSWDSTKPEIVFPRGTGVLMKANTEYQWEVI